LMVSCRKLRTITDVRMASGIEMAMITALRQLPRKIRIIRPVSAAAMTASRTTIDRTLNEDRLIREWLNLKLGWKGLHNVWEELADTLDDIDRRGVPSLQYSHQHPTISVLADDVCLGAKPVADSRNITKIDDSVSNCFDGQIVQVLNGFRISVQVDVVFEFTYLGGATGQDQVLTAERAEYVVRRNVLGLQQLWLRLIMIWRTLPPKGYGTAAPGTVTN
jgi:hypothetical protein